MGLETAFSMISEEESFKYFYHFLRKLKDTQVDNIKYQIILEFTSINILRISSTLHNWNLICEHYPRKEAIP